VIGPLTDPAGHGGDAADAFHVVVPTLPGSACPARPPGGWSTKRVAVAWAELMRRLGYDRYAAHGSDLGAAAGSSARYHRDGAENWGQPDPVSSVPTAVAVLPHDIGCPVRRIAEQTNTIVRWTEFPRGGHFAAMEEPDLIVADLRAALREHR
jgi:hypothetical protein